MSMHAQAETGSVPARAGFTEKVPQVRNTQDFNENDDFSEQCFEKGVHATQGFNLEVPSPPPVSTRKSAGDEKTTKSQSADHKCDTCGACTFSLEEDGDELSTF